VRTLPRVVSALRRRLHAETAHVEATFPYFLERRAPVTGAGLTVAEAAGRALRDPQAYDAPGFAYQFRRPRRRRSGDLVVASAADAPPRAG
jgi:hypothetical protein